MPFVRNRTEEWLYWSDTLACTVGVIGRAVNSLPRYIARKTIRLPTATPSTREGTRRCRPYCPGLSLESLYRLLMPTAITDESAEPVHQAALAEAAKAKGWE
jgi:hypothetical protein